MWFIAWFVLAIICGAVGNDRKIGGVAAFFIALLLSPIIGFIVVLISEPKHKPAQLQQQGNKWEALIEEAEIEKYKGNIDKAIDKYKEAQYYLQKRIDAISDKGVQWKYSERLDGLKMIVKKLETEMVK
jgi:hypothetical protein